MTHEDYVARRDRCAAAHVCFRCGKPLPEGDTRIYCPECRGKIVQSLQERYAERKARGLCTRCGKPARDGKTLCFDCALRRSEYYRTHERARNKEEKP